jgi:hypothetical protein
MSWLEQIGSYDDLFETRNSKSEARNKSKHKEGKTLHGARELKFRFRVRLFRISIFGFRIFFRWIPPNVLSRADKVIK